MYATQKLENINYEFFSKIMYILIQYFSNLVIYEFTQSQNKIFSTIFKNIFIYFSKKSLTSFMALFQLPQVTAQDTPIKLEQLSGIKDPYIAGGVHFGIPDCLKVLSNRLKSQCSKIYPKVHTCGQQKSAMKLMSDFLFETQINISF